MDRNDLIGLDDETVVMESTERYLVHQAVIGRDLEDFLRSTQGRYLKGRAMEAVASAVDAFIRIDPEIDSEDFILAIRNLHKRMVAARRNFEWVIEAISDGRQAEQQLDENQHND